MYRLIHGAFNKWKWSIFKHKYSNLHVNFIGHFYVRYVYLYVTKTKARWYFRGDLPSCNKKKWLLPNLILMLFCPPRGIIFFTFTNFYSQTNFLLKICLYKTLIRGNHKTLIIKIFSIQGGHLKTKQEE